NADNQFVDGMLQYTGERSQWNASLNLTRDTTLTSELGSTGIVQGSRRHESASISGGPTFLLSERISAAAQVYLLDSRYPDPGLSGLVDYRYHALSLTTSIAGSERSTFAVTAQGGELNVPDQDSRTRDANLRLAWTWQLHSLWTLDASVGPAYVESEYGHDNGTLFDVSVQRRGERWTLNTGLGRSLM